VPGRRVREPGVRLINSSSASSAVRFQREPALRRILQRESRRARHLTMVLDILSSGIKVHWDAMDTGQGPLMQPAVPADPIPVILDAFRSHDVVALGEGDHGNEQSYAFRLALIRDPRFAATVNDIVVEAGNARYQDVMDRFVRGEDVPDHALRQVWQNTTQPNCVFDLPIYQNFFRGVRAVPASLPRERQLRVLLGDSPIDWDRMQSVEDLRKCGDGNRHAADLIQLEVLEKRRRAVVIYGDMHFLRVDPFTNPPSERYSSIVALLEKAGTKVFSVWTLTSGDVTALQADVATWREPSLALLRGTSLGVAEFAFYYPFEVFNADGTGVRSRTGLRMEDEFDAVLYLGPPPAMTSARLSPALCADPGYMEMRLRRLAMCGMQREVDWLKWYCATVAPT
jgi:hypothetical protein